MDSGDPVVTGTPDLTCQEILFLITKYLDHGPCKQAAALLRKEIEDNHLVPMQSDWRGQPRNITLAQMEEQYNHIGPHHLQQMLCRLPQLLDTSHPPAFPGLKTLLGNGRQSCLRASDEDDRPFDLRSLLPAFNSNFKVANKRMRHRPPNLTTFVQATQYGGRSPVNYMNTSIYSKHKMHRRLLGHLSCVFCVNFDRTGQYCITGADDNLIKIWSAKDGRLLSTFRGHFGPISDMDVNPENTLLASGSIDRHVRIWNLKSGSPVAVLAYHSQQVSSVKFCPLVFGDYRYLVSLGNDGNIVFHIFNNKTFDFTQNKPIKINEKHKASNHLLCCSFSKGGTLLAIGAADRYVRVYHMTGPCGPTKLLEIEGHAGPVDSLQFSNLSTRFITGSKDGVTNIWTYESQTWANFSLVAVPTADSFFPEPDPLRSIKVNMVAWTCDDRHIITSSSDHLIRIWDGKTGKMIRHMKSSNIEDDIFVVEPHPNDPRILLTGGHDGRVNIWDIYTGKVLFCKQIMIEGQGYVNIFDGKFSKDGNCFVVTDSHGHLSFFGNGSSEPYKRNPDDVFFHTDYRPLVRDANNYVIDEQTQVPPHLMPPPFLVDVDGNPHEPRYQRLVPGREGSSDDQLVPYLAAPNERGVNEILVAAEIPPAIGGAIVQAPAIHAEAEHLPASPPILPIAASQNIPEPIVESAPLAPLPVLPSPEQQPRSIDHMIQQFLSQNNALPPVVPISAPNADNQIREEHGYAHPVVEAVEEPARPLIPVARNEGAQFNPEVQGVRMNTGNWRSLNTVSSSYFTKRCIVPPLRDDEVVRMRSCTKQYETFEEDYYEIQRKRAPIVTVRKEEPKKITRRVNRIQRQRLGQSGNHVDREAIFPVEGIRRNRRVNRIHDNENLSDDHSDNRFSGAESWTGSIDTSGDSDESGSDHEFQHTERRRSERPRPRPQPRRLDDNSNGPLAILPGTHPLRSGRIPRNPNRDRDSDYRSPTRDPRSSTRPPKKKPAFKGKGKQPLRRVVRRMEPDTGPSTSSSSSRNQPNEGSSSAQSSGPSSSRDPSFLKSLVLSDDDDETDLDEYPPVPAVNGTKRILEETDEDGTELEEEAQPEEEPNNNNINNNKGKAPLKKKVPIKNEPEPKRKKMSEDSEATDVSGLEDEEEEEDDEMTDIDSATEDETELSDEEVDEDADSDCSYGKPKRKKPPKKLVSKRKKGKTTKKRKIRSSDDDLDDDSDFEYEGMKSHGNNISSRGRIIKLKGQPRTTV